MKLRLTVTAFYDKVEEKYIFREETPTIERKDERGRQLIKAGVCEEILKPEEESQAEPEEAVSLEPEEDISLPPEEGTEEAEPTEGKRKSNLWKKK